MTDKLSFGIGLGKAGRQLSKQVKEEAAELFKKQFEETSVKLKEQLGKLKKQLSPDDFKIIEQQLEKTKNFHLHGTDVDKVAKNAGQTREAMAEQLATETVLKDHQEIIQTAKAEASRADMLAMMKVDS